MDVKIGELDKRISIVNVSTEVDKDGFETEKIEEICKAWAKVNNISGTEIFKAGGDYSKTNTRFLVRYRGDIEFTTDMQVKFIDKLFNIIYVNNYNYSNEFVELVAEVIE